MRTLISVLVIAAIVQGCGPSGSSSDSGPGIQWRGKNEAANKAASAAIGHYVNIENDAALTLFEHAVALDSSLFAPHVMLAFMKRGEAREHHVQMAKKFVTDKNDVSKMFVSLLDLPRDSTAVQPRRDIWAKMHEAAPEGLFIHYMYARSRAGDGDNRAARLAAIDELIAAAEKRMSTSILAGAYNLKAYTLQAAGDIPGGVAAVEKSMALYPTGYNPLDSRAEFYLFEGDTTQAIAMYKEVLDRHPVSVSARMALQDLEKK